MSKVNQEPLVVSFYTENTPYQLEVLSLIHSCGELGIELEVEAVPCLGSWQRNCARKPQFIRDKLLEKKRPVFWVDADAVFRKTPDFSCFSHSDFSLADTRKKDIRFRYRAGSIFINYTPGGILFVEAWVAFCQKRIDSGLDLTFIDQVAIHELIDKEIRLN